MNDLSHAALFCVITKCMTEVRTCSVKVSVVPIRLEYPDLEYTDFDEDIKWGKLIDEYTQAECIYREGMTTRVKS
jgi:hypothetical protein